MNIRNEIKEKSGILNEAEKEYIHVSVGDDMAEGIFEKGTGNVIWTFDMYHGDNPDSAIGLARRLGAKITEIPLDKLLQREKGLKRTETNTTSEIPNLNDIRRIVRDM